MSLVHRASAALTELARDYPGVWGRMDKLLRDVRAGGVTWPEWCWAPMAAAYAIVSDGQVASVERGGDIARVAALTAWRVSQGIYRVDETLLDELWNSELDGALPVETLLHLPEWCVYVETPGRSVFGAPLYGFWAHLESDSNDGRVELRLLLDGDGPPVGLPLHLARGKGTLADAAEGFFNETIAQAALTGQRLEGERLVARRAEFLNQAEQLRPLISVVLYLATTAEELRDMKGQAPSKPKPRPGRRGEAPRNYPPAVPPIFLTGVRLGAALRAARARAAEGGSAGGGATPAGHVRRAHWHTYLMGPRTGPQRREVRWLPPIFVGLDGAESLAPVIRTVD